MVERLLDQKLKNRQQTDSSNMQGRPIVDSTPKRGIANCLSGANNLINVKSPSDTTVYRPALQCRGQVNDSNQAVMMQQITNFVDLMHVEP